MSENYRSIQAVRAASLHCSPEAFATLEAAVVRLTDAWEARHARTRGLRQLQLLTTMDHGRLGESGRASLAALRAKFPEVTQEPPTAIHIHCVGSPIKPEAQDKMNDDQWLSAMAKYAGVDRRRDGRSPFSGGEYQLAQALEERTKADPKRFVNLAVRMPNDFPPSYFDAIVHGVANANSPDASAGEAIAARLEEVVRLLERVHELPSRPCGRSVAYLVEKQKKARWPNTIIEAIAWYAVNDPDPTEEIWRKRAASGQSYYGGDPYLSGLNSTRGAAAGAVAQLLFDDPARTSALLSAIDHLAHDHSVAVRSRAVEPLLALLNTQVDVAIRWFVECVAVDPVLLVTPLVERFVYFAGHRDYAAVRPTLQKMLSSTEAKAAEAAARVCCLVALSVEDAKEDSEQTRGGSAILRTAAATIYSTNVANKEVGAVCRTMLRPFFADAEETVRAHAAEAFRYLTDLGTAEQSELLAAFLDANPSAAALEPVIRALEDSPVRLPNLVCRLVEAGIEAFKTEAGDIRTSAAGTAFDLSKIVIRLYTQSDDEGIRRRCLDAIDRMEQAGFFGLSEELRRYDR